MAKENLGFIIDSPNCLIKSSKGDLIIDKASSGTVTFTGDQIEISAGQGFLALAAIPKTTKIEVKITNAEFSLEQMAMSAGSSVVVGAQEFTKFDTSFAVATGNTFIIPEVAVIGSIRINGFTEVTAIPATGEFKVAISATETTLTFFTDVEVGTILKPSYKILTSATTVSVRVKNNEVPGSAECILSWPIYESDTVESEIWGTAQLTLFKAKINQSFSIGGSYKTASVFDLNLTALDARRPDLLAWSFVILPLLAE